MQNSESQVIVLDCTLRDGGYYTDWDYTPEFVRSYLEAINDSGVDFVELGLRLPPRAEYFGPFAYCTEDFIGSLPLSPGVKYGVMINTSDFVASDQEYTSHMLRKLFRSASESPVQLVRVATHFGQIHETLLLVSELRKLGYTTAINLMQIGQQKPEDVTKALELIAASRDLPDVLYFADSLGNMGADQVEDVIDLIRKKWQGPLGIHAHNNMGQALANTLAARKKGATWLDGTIMGMGRGAGNAATEILLQELTQLKIRSFNSGALFRTVMEQFTPLQKEHGWGPNLLYYLSARKNIHPTFVQQMQSAGVYTPSQMLHAITNLGEQPSQSYSQQRLATAMQQGGQDIGDGAWNAVNWCKDRDILILANGPQVKAHKAAIIDFIRKRKPVTVSLNINNCLSNELVDYYAVCSKTRIMIEMEDYKDLGKPVFMPEQLVSPELCKSLKIARIYDYGVRVESGRLEPGTRQCVIPYPLVAPYVLCLATVGGARRIFVVGFDGYKHSQELQSEMEQTFSLYAELKTKVPVISLTRTTYSKLEHNSVYNPGV